MAEDVLDVLEAAYRLEGDDRSWLDRVSRAVRAQIDPRHVGVFAFFYELTSEGVVRVHTPLTYDVLPPYDVVGPAVPSKLPPWYVRQTFAQYPCATATHSGSTQARALTRTALRTAFGEIGWRDLFIVNGLDPTGHGVYIGAARKRAAKLPRPLQARWTRVAVHLASAWRLKRTLREVAARAPDTAEAVLAPDGKIAHAAEPAKAREARRLLTNAAQVIERARTRRGREDRAVAEWTGLIAARWSLVDHFEADGKRWLLARRNDVASVGDAAALSPRELQAVAFAALGHDNKLIAYEMGITAETVRVLLHRAAKKLRARDRAELITRARLTFTPTL
jgi:DNA-binding CsgD family transcriptional regulator